MQRPFLLAAKVWLLLATVVLVFVSGCATKKGLIVDPAKPQEIYDTKPVSVLTGKASYYYGRWIGRLTANGETYRAGDVTAAHKSLPFNTMVRVTNLKNGKQVIVRINNRGPYVKGRILDLSLVAAQRIEMTQAGVVPVRAEILRKIEVVPKIKPKATEKARREAEKKAAEAAQAKPKPTPNAQR
jgi:rare lipoprotein A